ncbi:MAG: PQQ-binding-like beta-propeller repeat protein, partial [Thermoanaerobaculia bacterium]|nr:PQQ-binding-like beta-propeller repeat protein [Thermoanaerobaculia bacterium]
PGAPVDCAARPVLPPLRGEPRRWPTVVLAAAAAAAAAGAEPPIPTDFDLGTGRHVLGQADVGSYAYAGPVLAEGRVFVGTNNARPRDPSRTGDLGVLMAFSARDGRFLWQAGHEKLDQDRDFPLQGLCSTPAVHGDRIFYVSNRGELVSADVEGFHDGENDGPFAAEARTGHTDVDVVWSLDMAAELGVVAHFMAASTPLVDGDLVFVVTGNGIAEGGGVPAPEAPSFLAVRRDTGEVVWSDATASSGLVDGQWGSARMWRYEGRFDVVFPGGDGFLYGLDPDNGDIRWRFDGNRPPGGEVLTGRRRNAFVASPTVVGSRLFVALGRDPEEGSGDGALWALEGSAGGTPATSWFLGGDAFGRAIADVAVAAGVAYAADLDGFVVALDAATGAERWRYDTLAPIWATPLVTEQGVWVVDTDGDVTLLGDGADLEVRAEVETWSPIYRAPVVAGGVMYLLTTERLYAIGEGG